LEKVIKEHEMKFSFNVMLATAISAISAVSAFNVNAQDFNSWAVSMGQNQTMTSAICHQSGNCKKTTAEQLTRRKAITEQASACIRRAFDQYRSDDPRRQLTIDQCKAVRDQQHAANMGRASTVSAKKSGVKPKS
jgi:Spy/CpxP family protein refolding chaperone